MKAAIPTFERGRTVKTNCKSRHYQGYTLIEIMIVATIVGLLAVIAVCNYIIARDTSRLAVIRTNLRDIETAKEQWAFEYKKNVGEPVADVDLLKEYLRQGKLKVIVSETYNPNPI